MQRRSFNKALAGVAAATALSPLNRAFAQSQKLKRGDDRLTLELEPTPDILAELGAQPPRHGSKRILVGFAAETSGLAENARAKLARKGADMIVANDVTQEGAGFDTDTNIVTLFVRDGSESPVPKLSKFDVANRVLDHILLLQEK